MQVLLLSQLPALRHSLHLLKVKLLGQTSVSPGKILTLKDVTAWTCDPESTPGPKTLDREMVPGTVGHTAQALRAQMPLPQGWSQETRVVSL